MIHLRCFENSSEVGSGVKVNLGDMEVTYADTSKFNEIFRFQPSVNIEDGIKYFISWYSTQTASV